MYLYFILRILEKFANIYYNQNGNPTEQINNTTAIKSSDVAYILSFSILMLNTDLHNPSVPLKNKMTMNEFIRNNRGINNGLDIPKEELEGLYVRIKNNEIKMDMADMMESDVPAFMAPILAGSFCLFISMHVCVCIYVCIGFCVLLLWFIQLQVYVDFVVLMYMYTTGSTCIVFVLGLLKN